MYTHFTKPQFLIQTSTTPFGYIHVHNSSLISPNVVDFFISTQKTVFGINFDASYSTNQPAIRRPVILTTHFFNDDIWSCIWIICRFNIAENTKSNGGKLAYAYNSGVIHFQSLDFIMCGASILLISIDL